MKTARNIVVKTMFNPDEFLAFESRCTSADLSQSRALRDLANDWIRRPNDSRDGRLKNSPERGHKRPVSLPPRQVSHGFRLRV